MQGIVYYCNHYDCVLCHSWLQVWTFTQTKIDVEVTQIESTTKRTINSAMYRFDNPDRKTKKDYVNLATPNAYSTLEIQETGILIV